MLIAILQLESQGECRESATEAVLMVGYTSDGILNQDQTRWLSWNVAGGVRGFDLARNAGLSNTTEYGAGKFPLPTKPPAGTETQSTSKALSMILSQQTEESYPDLSNLMRELERAQRERDQANLDSDQANLEREKEILDLDLLKADPEQAQKLHESVANRDQLKSEIELLERKQHEFASGKESKVKTSTDPLMTRSRPVSRMEVDQAPRSSGHFNLDRIAQEHMNEGLDTRKPSEPVPSLKNLQSGRIRPLMDIALPCLTLRSTLGRQTGMGKSRLKELQERLQSRTPERSTREAEPLTLREHPVRSVIIASYKKNTDGAYHRYKRDD